MKKGRLIKLLSIITMAAAGVFGVVSHKSSKKAETVEAGSVTKTRIVLEIQDECWCTNDSRDPKLHLYNIQIDSSMGYNSSDLIGDLRASGGIDDFETGGANIRRINDDGSIDTGFTWRHQSGSYRYWQIKLPWYVTGFDYKIWCGNYWSTNAITGFHGHGRYMVYLTGYWDNWGINSMGNETSSSVSNEYSVSNYTISTATSGGAPSSTNTAYVKGNGGSYVTSGVYYTRQKIDLKATAGTYSAFDHWNYGHSTSSSSTYDYVGTADKAYVATFSDTRQKFTVTFKDYDGTTLETKTNQFQGSSVSITTTPTRATEGKIVYTFDHWEDSSGNDKTSALADLQSDLTVYAAYSISYSSGFYVYGDFGTTPTWDPATAYLMTEFSETSYAWSAKVTIELPYRSVFKIKYYNAGWPGWDNGQEFDTRNLQNDSPAKYCYDCNRADHAFECYATGRYTIILHNFQNQGKSIYINFENDSRTAEELAAYLLSFGSSPQSGTCGDGRFAFAKNMFLNQLSSSEKTIFQGYHSDGILRFRDAYHRYVAWAAALGENPWASGAANNGKLLATIATKETANVVGIVIISLISVSSIGAYFFLRKRKEN